MEKDITCPGKGPGREAHGPLSDKIYAVLHVIAKNKLSIILAIIAAGMIAAAIALNHLGDHAGVPNPAALSRAGNFFSLLLS